MGGFDITAQGLETDASAVCCLSSPVWFETLAHLYLDAKLQVIGAGFASEIDWYAEGRARDRTTESELLTEVAWVIFNSGMRESVVRRLFPRLAQAFLGFESAQLIADNAEACRDRACLVFNHRIKANAVIEFSRRTAEMGYVVLLERLKYEGVAFLESFPFMGPATSRHLGKNLGLDIAKPDRHLVRIAIAAGFGNPQELCECISRWTGDDIAQIDVVLWRFATINGRYEEMFRGPPPFGAPTTSFDFLPERCHS